MVWKVWSSFCHRMFWTATEISPVCLCNRRLLNQFRVFFGLRQFLQNHLNTSASKICTQTLSSLNFSFSKLQSAHSLSHKHRIVTETEVPHTNCDQILTLPKISTTCAVLEITANTPQGDRRGGSRSRFKISKNKKTKKRNETKTEQPEKCSVPKPSSN